MNKFTYMKVNFFLLQFFICFNCIGQNKLPLIKASAFKATITEGEDEISAWYLDARIKPDVFTMSKTINAKKLKFKTDIDSISLKLKPGQSFEFIVLLGDSDSCYTKIVCPSVKNFSYLEPAVHDTIPFVLSPYNNIIVKSIVNDKDTLNLKFDTGTNGFLLTNETLVNKVDIPKLDKNKFQIGKQIFEKQEIFPVVLSGQGSDGRFGWNIFDGMIVEIDYDLNLFIIHSKLPKINKAFRKFDMYYAHTLLSMDGALQIKQKKFKSRFLFDNGYQRTLMLDQNVMQRQSFPKEGLEVIKKTVMQNGQGKEIPVITANNEIFKLGNFTLTNVPVQLMTTENPAGFETHIMGNEVLKRFNTILDFQKNKIYLRPNKLYNENYAEGIK